MFRLIGLLVFLTCVLHFCLASSALLDDTHNHIKPQSLALVGRTATKAYFSDERLGNWSVSKQFCENSGMKLATFETQEEVDVLMNAKYEKDVFAGWYWTAARDVRNVNQLVWDGKNSSIPRTFPLTVSVIPDGVYLTCGMFEIFPTYRGLMFAECNRSGRVICEA